MIETLEDNTQLQVKAWLDKHFRSILLTVAFAIAITLGYQYYERHLVDRDVAASKLFDEYQQALIKGDEDPLVASFKKLRDDYPQTPYASAVALLEASRAAFDEHYTDAEETLNWVRSHGRDFAKPLATLRLAQLKFEQKDFEAATAVLDALPMTDTDANGAYMAGFEELRGDIAVAKGEPQKASLHYSQALAAYQAQDYNNVLLQMKTETYR